MSTCLSEDQNEKSLLFFSWDTICFHFSFFSFKNHGHFTSFGQVCKISQYTCSLFICLHLFCFCRLVCPPPHADLWPPRPLPAHLLSAWGLHDRVYALSMVVVLVWTTFIWVNVHNVHFWELLHDQDRFFPLKFPKCGKYLSAWRDQIYADWKCCTVFCCLISYFKDYVIQKRKVSKKLFINFLSSLFNRAVHKVWVSLSLSLSLCVCVCVCVCISVGWCVFKDPGNQNWTFVEFLCLIDSRSSTIYSPYSWHICDPVHKTSRKCNFFEIEIYTASESWLNNLSIDVWFVRIGQWENHL